MKYADINRRYTQIIAEYINKGFIINSSTMEGHQGETCKIDLTNGVDIIRIMLTRFHTTKTRIWLDGLKIVVGLYNKDSVKPNHPPYSNNTIWEYDLSLIHVECFYKIDTYVDYFVDNAEDALRASELRMQRFKFPKPNQEIKSERAKVIAKKIVKDKMGYQRINPLEVRIFKSGDTDKYFVEYRGQLYVLK